MKVSEEKARQIVFGNYEGWKEIERNIIDTSRWGIILRGVFKYEDKYYQVDWEEGATEMQESIPFECEGVVELIEVEEVEKIVKVFLPCSEIAK